jgi:hypothetical protein
MISRSPPHSDQWQLHRRDLKQIESTYFSRPICHVTVYVRAQLHAGKRFLHLPTILLACSNMRKGATGTRRGVGLHGATAPRSMNSSSVSFGGLYLKMMGRRRMQWKQVQARIPSLLREQRAHCLGGDANEGAVKLAEGPSSTGRSSESLTY